MGGQLPTTHDLATLAVVVVILAVGAAEVVLSIVRRRRGGPSAPVPAATWAGWVAAACSIAAAVIHLAVIEEHLAEYVPFGIAFALLAIFQLAWPLAYLPRPTRALALAAVVINLGAVVVWVWSRSWGLPIGPEPGRAGGGRAGRCDLVAARDGPGPGLAAYAPCGGGSGAGPVPRGPACSRPWRCWSSVPWPAWRRSARWWRSSA